MYEAEISRRNPTCFLFVIDQSGSMEEGIGATDGAFQMRKADVVADAINRLLEELTLKAAKEEGVRDWYQIGVLGYGAGVSAAFGGDLAGRSLVPVSEVASAPIRIEDRMRKVPDGAGGVVEQSVKFPVWFDAVHENGTPMCQALGEARVIIENWVGEHPDSFPPIVMNLTDGESTDGDPSAAAEEIKQLKTSDGEVLLFNCHISSHQGNLDGPMTIMFPSSEQGLPNDFAKLLFRMSSAMPAPMLDLARAGGYGVSEGSRGFVFNADIVSIIHFLDYGTKVTDDHVR